MHLEPNTLNITGKNNDINGKFYGNITISGIADSTKITGKCLGTITLAAGVDNCDIWVGVTTADNSDDTNNSIIDNSETTTNRIRTYKLT